MSAVLGVMAPWPALSGAACDMLGAPADIAPAAGACASSANQQCGEPASHIIAQNASQLSMPSGLE